MCWFSPRRWGSRWDRTCRKGKIRVAVGFGLRRSGALYADWEGNESESHLWLGLAAYAFVIAIQNTRRKGSTGSRSSKISSPQSSHSPYWPQLEALKHSVDLRQTRPSTFEQWGIRLGVVIVVTID